MMTVAVDAAVGRGHMAGHRQHDVIQEQGVCVLGTYDAGNTDDSNWRAITSSMPTARHQLAASGFDRRQARIQDFL